VLDRAAPQSGPPGKLGIDATRRKDDRPDWRRARPPESALERARELLRAQSIRQSSNETKSSHH